MKRTRDGNVGLARAFRAIKSRPGRIVIIAPHPDDETLGAGRFILKARRHGLMPAFIILTGGGASHPHSQKWPARRLVQLRKQELRRALGRLGLVHPVIRHMGWRDGHLPDEGQVSALRAMLHSLNATTVLVTSAADHHQDHKAAFRLAEAACDRRKMMLWTYAVWSRVDAISRQVIARDRGQQRWAARAHRQPNDRLYR